MGIRKEKVTAEELANIQIVGELPEYLKSNADGDAEISDEQMRADANEWAQTLKDR